uniref:Uncharacterized protein n=1 Tax=Arundo donax TaxID=35708 RepID=A0A0A9BHT8_ARUDO
MFNSKCKMPKILIVKN